MNINECFCILSIIWIYLSLSEHRLTVPQLLAERERKRDGGKERDRDREKEGESSKERKRRREVPIKEFTEVKTRKKLRNNFHQRIKALISAETSEEKTTSQHTPTYSLQVFSTQTHLTYILVSIIHLNIS